jgi:limonene 1,2-monooxygenase
MLENFWIVGDPDDCARQIRQLYGDTGGFGTLLVLCHDWGDDRAKGLRSLELLAKETLPQLDDLNAN